MIEQLTYLLEIGTEELPASFLETSRQELQDRTKEALDKNRLSFGRVEVLQTPRRLTVIIHDLAASQAAMEEMVKGPPASVALDANGNPTPAALGFAKKMGIDVTALQRETLEGTEYLVYHKQSHGRPVAEVLPQILPDVVLGLSGSHFMVWDASDIKFSRPIRWLVSILGNQHLPLQMGLVHSGTVSRGHRFLATQPEVAVSSVSSYATQLWDEGHVMVNQDERRHAILAGLRQKAESLNGKLSENEALLDTVTMLVESPALVAGSFAPDFLDLPKEVITTVMAAHQKYFPVESASGELLPYFITISNNTLPSAESSIRHGNEKVLRARLEDAGFFFQEDTRHTLADYVDRLKGITFQKGLGTLYDKTVRLETLVALMGPLMGLSTAEVADSQRAAHLCKADLATHMVRELTELQGVIGKHYAERSNEKPAVAAAIAEHYQPRFMGDAVAASPVGTTLSLADKLDSMVAIFAQKGARYPTGSKDPMGLRRMALGVIQTILENKSPLNLDAALQAAYQNLGSLAQESEADTLDRTRQFLLQRFKGYLLDQSFSYDTIDAVLESEVSPFANVCNTMARLHLLKQLQQAPDRFKAIYEPANRTARILGKAYQPQVTAAQIQPTLLEDASEKALYDGIAGYNIEQAMPNTALDDFSAWSPLVDAFFEHVLVNAEDSALRENRYRLLSLLNRFYRQFADFTKLVV